MKGRRLVLFLPHVSDGGAERVLLSLGEHYAGRGLDVHLLVAGRIADSARPLKKSFRIVEGKVRSTPLFLPRLARELGRVRPNAVLSALPHANLIASVAHLLTRSKARLVLTEHLAIVPTRVQRSRGSALFRGQKRVFDTALARAYQRADAVVAVSDGVAEDLKNAYGVAPPLLHVIANPVLVSNFAERASASLPPPFVWERKSTEKGPRLVSVGRLTAQKDVATCLRAFAKLRKERPAELVILGDGEERANLEALSRELEIADSVRFLGVVENPLPFMRTADVLVHTARYEGLGNVLVEALACGTPVVATDCPHGPRQIVSALGNGILVSVGDVAAVADAIATTLQGSGRRLPAPDALAQYSLDHAALRYAELLFVK